VEALDCLKKSPFDKDDQGFMYVNGFLQTDRYDNVFGGGDCVQIKYYERFPPKAGVYAVREAPFVADNILAYLQNVKHGLSQYIPQVDFLSLLNLGDNTCLAQKGGLSLEGWLMWKLKDYIDRSFMRRMRTVTLVDWTPEKAMK
jgi:selenide,water dikinase